MSDVFKKVYVPLRASSSALILEAKNKAEELLEVMSKNIDGTGYGDSVSPSVRELALAKTNLEQAMMWYTKAVVLADEAILKIKEASKGIS